MTERESETSAKLNKPDLGCSTWAREQGLDPIGTAGSYSGYLIVEWPLPWPRDISLIPELEELSRDARSFGLRIQGVVTSGSGPRRVVLYRRRPDRTSGAGFTRVDWSGAPAEEVGAARSLLSSDGGAEVLFGSGEVLVCTHGRRDRCCGSKGTALAIAMQDRSSTLVGNRRIWRTSHTGGHRFAPTALVFPDATAWAYLDENVLSAIVRRTGSLESVLEHYRGYAGLDSPAAQAIEREVIRELGWDAFSMPRWSEQDGDVTRVCVLDATGATLVWEGAVATRRSVVLPDCGSPLESGAKTEIELEVSTLVRVA